MVRNLRVCVVYNYNNINDVFYLLLKFYLDWDLVRIIMYKSYLCFDLLFNWSNIKELCKLDKNI